MPCVSSRFHYSFLIHFFTSLIDSWNWISVSSAIIIVPVVTSWFFYRGHQPVWPVPRRAGDDQEPRLWFLHRSLDYRIVIYLLMLLLSDDYLFATVDIDTGGGGTASDLEALQRVPLCVIARVHLTVPLPTSNCSSVCPIISTRLVIRSIIGSTW